MGVPPVSSLLNLDGGRELKETPGRDMSCPDSGAACPVSTHQRQRKPALLHLHDVELLEVQQRVDLDADVFARHLPDLFQHAVFFLAQRLSDLGIHTD